MKRYLFIGFACLLGLLSSQSVRASHAQGADITYQFVSYDSVSGVSCYIVTVTFYRDCAGISAPNSVDVDLNNMSCPGGTYDTTITLNQVLGLPCPFGGTSTAADGCLCSPICPADIGLTTCGGTGQYPGVEQFVYQGTICLPGRRIGAEWDCNQWYIGMGINARNAAITNLVGPGSTTLWVEAMINDGNYGDTAKIVTKTSPTTQITAFPDTGTYGFIWTSFGCTDTAYIHVSNTPAIVGPNDTICQGAATNLQAAGAGSWVASPGNPATVTINNTLQGNSPVSGFTVPGLYTFTWTSTSCGGSYPQTVLVRPGPNAGADQTICSGGTATMAATGAGNWYAQFNNPGIGTITTPTDSATTITGLTIPGTYQYIWVSAGVCPGTDTAEVIVKAIPSGGPAQITCPGSIATMAATNTSTGTWTALATNYGSHITNAISPVTTITGIDTAGTYRYIWTTSGVCLVSDTATVIVPVKPNAGPDQTLCSGATATLAAIGTGYWTYYPSNPRPTVIADPNLPNTTVTGFTAGGIYSFIWNANECTDTVNIIVTPKPNAGPDQVACQNGIATMAATGAGTWYGLVSNLVGSTAITPPTSPTPNISGLTVPGLYSFVWVSGGCTDTANVVVSPKPYAGPPQVINCPGSSALMDAAGSGTWTAMGGNPATITIANNASPTTFVSGMTVAGTYGIVWSVFTGGCSDTAFVTVVQRATAGPDQHLCAGTTTATMAASGTGTWSIEIGNPAGTTITTPTSTSTTITGFSIAGNYHYIWTSTGACAGVDTVTVTVQPVSNAGPDQTICQNSDAFMVAVGSGTWSLAAPDPSINISNLSNPNTIISGFSGAGTYGFIWTTPGCPNPDTANVIVTPGPDAGPPQTLFCPAVTASLAASGTGTWSVPTGNPAIAVVTTPTSPTSPVTGLTVAGRYRFVWTSSTTACADTAYITLLPYASAGPDQTLCSGATTTTMAATGTGTWSVLTTNPAMTVVTNQLSPITTITGFSTAGAYGYVWLSNGICTGRDTVYVTIEPKSNAGPDQTICFGNNATMAAQGYGTWTLVTPNPAVHITTPTSPTTTVTGFPAAGTYGLIWTSAGCASADTANIIVGSKATAGPDETILCPGFSTNLAAQGTGTWTVAGNNPSIQITDPNSPTTGITGFPGPGTYPIIWTSPVCTVSDTANVILLTVPASGGNQTICGGNVAKMAASGRGTWTQLPSNPINTTITTPTLDTTTIAGLTLAGTYKYIWTAAAGCFDTVSLIVTAKPNAGADQSICQFSTITMAATGAGTWSPLDSNPSAANIVNTASPTTTVSAFDSTGVYGFVWTSNGCTDTMKVTVTAKPNAGADQTVTCGNGATIATLAGIGSGIWSVLLPAPDTASIINPGSPTTTVTGFRISGNYGFIWTSNVCADTAYVAVSAKPNAGPDQTTCIGSNAVMAATGTGTWSVVSGNPGTATIVSSTSPVTAITSFPATGTYGYIWTSGACADTAYVVVVAKPSAGGDQTLGCHQYTATMAGTGTGFWYPLPTNHPGPQILSPYSPTTKITGFRGTGIYGYVWQSDAGCSDTANVIVPSISYVGPPQSICIGGTVSMAASGSGTWTALSSNPTTLNHIEASSPVFTSIPVPFVCDTCWYDYNNGAVTASGDSLSYQLIDPLQSHGSGIPFVGGYTQTNPIITRPGDFNFNSLTGQLNFRPSQTDADVLAILVSEYQNGVLVGTVIRDIEVKILNCNTPPAIMDTPSALVNAVALDTVTVQLCPNVTSHWSIHVADAVGDSLYIKSNITSPNSPLPGATFTSSYTTGSSVTANFTWTPTLADTGCHYYLVTGNIISCPVEGNTTKTYQVCVLDRISITPHLAIYCGTPIHIHATGGRDISWTPGTNLVMLDSVDVLVSPPATQLYTYTSNCGTDTSLIISNAIFAESAGPGGAICQNGQLQMDATVDSLYAPYQIVWHPGTGLFNPITNVPDSTILDPIASPLVTTTYTVSFTGNSGCVRTDTVTVNVHGEAPAIQANANPSIICPGEQVMLWATDNPPCGLAATACLGTSTNITIGTATTYYGGTGFSYPAPYGNYYYSARHQFLFHANEISSLVGSGGTITSLAMDVAVTNSGSQLSNFTISLACVPDDSLTGYTATPLTQVYSGTFLPPAAGWNTTVFQNAYNWDGVSNLVVDVCFNNTTGNNLNPKMYYSVTPFRSMWFTAANADECGVAGTVPAPLPSYATYFERPNFQFDVCTTPLGSASLSWTPNTGPDAPAPLNRDTAYADPQGQTTYQVTLTDTNGCSSSAFVSVYVNAPVTMTLGPDTFICNADSIQLNDSVSLPVGSTVNPANIFYTWSTYPSYVSPPPSGAGPGFAHPIIHATVTTTYICNITETGMCQVTDSATVTVGSHLPVNKVVDSVLCHNGTDGKIVINMSAGIPPYTYVWTGTMTGGNVDSLANLPAPGTYELMVTDQAGCTGFDTTTLLNPPILAVTLDSTNISCFGDSNGTIKANVTGGRAPYRYTWSAAGTTNTDSISGLMIGLYRVTVTDTSGCTAMAQVNLTQPTPLVSSDTISNLTTYLIHDGEIWVRASGGIPRYHYTWTPAVAGDTSFANNLDTGMYYILVCDTNNCCVHDTAHVIAPPPLYIIFTITNNPCAGDSDGTAFATVWGGVRPYTYHWTTGSTSDTITGLAGGIIYTVTVTDSNGLSVANDTSIYSPQPVQMSIDSTPVTCFGYANATLKDSAWGGTGAYTYLWSPGGATADSLNNVGPGTYTVTVTDVNHCTGSATAYVGQPTPVTAVITANDSVLCFGQSNGIATVLAGGGTPGYTYAWSGGNPLTTATVNNLPAGPYTVTVSDSRGCTATVVDTMYQPTALTSVAIPTNTTGFGIHDGTVGVHSSGGSPSYSYTWTPSVAGNVDTASGLDTGTYYIQVCDSKGCCVNDTAYITGPPPITIHFTVINDSCFGYCDGSATAHVTGGVPPYTYLWSYAGSTTSSITGLCAATYTVTVTDSNLVTAIRDTIITQPAPLGMAIDSTPVSCYLGTNATLFDSVYGGTAPYTIIWNHGSGNPLTGLGLGTYIANVTDLYGCTASDTAYIGQPTQVTATITLTDSVLCFGQSNGVATVLGAGGTPGYTYAWSGSAQTTATVNDLAAGLQTVTVTDHNGCTASASFTIYQPQQLTVTVTPSPAHCATSNDGSAIAIAANGTPGYTYQWDAINTGAVDSITSLASGSHSLTVTDSRGCTLVQPFTVDTIYVLHVSMTSDSVVCNGGSTGSATVTVLNGSPGYSYVWSPSQSLTNVAANVAAGQQTVTVTDMYNCVATGSVMVSQPNPVADTVYFLNPSCYGYTNGKAWISAGGTEGPYTYSFSGVIHPITDTIFGLSDGTYYFTVHDGKSCPKADSVTLTNPSPLVATSSQVGITCAGANNGHIEVNASGGTPPYGYTWSIGTYTDSMETTLAPGDYVITVTDSHGCTYTVTQTLVNPPPLSFWMIVSDSTTCPDSANGIIEFAVRGGTPANTPPPYMFSIGGTTWQVLPEFFDLAAGSYTIYAMDSP